MNLLQNISKIFKSSNQQELDKVRDLIVAINDKENELNLYLGQIKRNKF